MLGFWEKEFDSAIEKHIDWSSAHWIKVKVLVQGPRAGT